MILLPKAQVGELVLTVLPDPGVGDRSIAFEGSFQLTTAGVTITTYQQAIIFTKADKMADITTTSGTHADAAFLAGLYQKALAKLQ